MWIENYEFNKKIDYKRKLEEYNGIYTEKKTGWIYRATYLFPLRLYVNVVGGHIQMLSTFSMSVQLNFVDAIQCGTQLQGKSTICICIGVMRHERTCLERKTSSQKQFSCALEMHRYLNSLFI